MAKLSEELQKYADDGLKLCRAGDWNKGLSVLASVLEQRGPSDQVPGVVYSYLGYGVARFQNKVREGLKLCEHSLKLQYYEAENHWNLARVQALAGERQAAHQTIEHGLKLDPDHAGLLATQRELGVRKPPIIGFLSRDNPINVMLGRWRHSLRKDANAPEPATPGAPPSPRSRMAATGTRTPMPQNRMGATGTRTPMPGANATPAPRNRPPAAAPNPTEKGTPSSR
jgi:tetratricopeptide (TPR) repeat protein